MKRLLSILFFCLFISVSGQKTDRIHKIQNQLVALATDNSGLTENLKLEINVNTVPLSDFLLAVSKIHKLNLSVEPSLKSINIVNNFSNVSITDLLLFLCKEYELDIKFTGNILSVDRYIAPPLPPTEEKEKPMQVSYDAVNNRLSLDLKGNSLNRVFREIMDTSGQNILYTNSMANLPLTLYLNNVPTDIALKKLAETNSMSVKKSKDGFYLFNSNLASGKNINKQYRGGSNNFYYQILDTVQRILTVDFQNTPISSIVTEISNDLNLDVYTASPLEKAGNISFKAQQINFDELLKYIFEGSANINVTNNNAVSSSSNSSNGNRNTNNLPPPYSNFTFKKERNVYFFGTSDQLSVRKVEIVPMMFRSVELLGDPSQNAGGGRSSGRTLGGNINYLGGGYQNNNSRNNQGINSNSFNNNFSSRNNQNNDYQRSSFANNATKTEAILNIIPDDVMNALDIKVDYELNSFHLSGPAANINRFKSFIKEIDKPVPVVLIEVMIIEVKKSATVETGVSWGVGEAPVTTSGSVFPDTDMTLGAKTVNKVIGGFSGFGSFNIGQVVPNFFATIKAMEQNGNIKIKSTPKLSTLNGHRAHLSIGETTYYVVTNQNFFGSQIPATSEIRNYQPIDAELAISIKPLVSGNGQVTLDINVIQSDFSGTRIEKDAPPGLTSREFSSIIRMQNQDLAVLGGLEEKKKNDSGTGVPLLARIPIIKWLFSKKKREDSKQKLTILIKPTVIY